MMPNRTRLLLIDDDAVDRVSVRRALTQSGIAHELVEAQDGSTGLRLARAQTFDFILLDYRLPDVDTFELLAALLSPDGGGQAVLMLTGEVDQDIAHRLMRAGALDYITKDECTPSSLTRAIRYAKARREFHAQLTTARREAEQKSLALDTLNRQKTLLFSIIAHDLRNPFQALLGLSSVLSQAVAAKDHVSIERRAQGIREAASQAYSLMESLFAWASLQMDTVTVALDDVDLSDIAEATIKSAAESAADKGLVLKVECHGFRVRAHGDMLAAVLRNLISNAIKFTLPKGTITISAKSNDNGVEITVSDTGIGMPPNMIADLFKLDRRTTTSGTAGERGSGLGLLLCRDLVERQGSELTVRSEVNRGTSFRFTLPAVITRVDVGF
jgi:two-component system sensor histidine kinase/response regulator